MARPAWIPTPERIIEVEKLASRGLTKEQIADCLGIHYDTLNEKSKAYPEFAEAIKRGQASGIDQVANSLFENAMKGNVTAQIFFMKARAKWSDGSNDDKEKDEKMVSEFKKIGELISKCVQPIP